MTEDERRFDAAMLDLYATWMREIRYPARRFLAMVRRRGGVESAKRLLRKPGVSPSFERIRDAGKLMATVEYLVLRPEFSSLFTSGELQTARSRLLEHGLTNRDLPTQ